jgi:hypothetical protein
MLTNGESYIAFWAPRIGRRAAESRWLAAKMTARGYAVAVCGFVLFPFGSRLGPVLLTLAIALVVVGGGLLAAGVYKVFTTNSVIGETLGLPIGPGRIAGPPRRADAYTAWCKKHGVTPYAADQPVTS